MENTESWWIGDLCYVLDDCWDEVCDLMFPDGGEKEVTGEFILSDGRKFINYGTAFGDGEYQDQYGNRYGVDSGGIGAVRVSDLVDFTEENSGGHVHELSEPITALNSGFSSGIITLGPIVIDTAGDDCDGDDDWGCGEEGVSSGDDYDEDEEDYDGDDEGD